MVRNLNPMRTCRLPTGVCSACAEAVDFDPMALANVWSDAAAERVA